MDYCGVEVWSINNLLSPQLVFHWNPVNCPVGQWEEAPVHANELILQKECNLLFLSSGKSDMMVLDISDPNAIFAADSFGTVLDTAGVWGIDVTPDYIYLAYVYVGDLPFLPEPFHSYWGGMKQLTYENCGLELKEEDHSGVAIFPNPTDDELIIQMRNANFSFEIQSISGQTMERGQGDGSISLNTFDYPAGIYTVHLITSENTIQRKFIRK